MYCAAVLCLLGTYASTSSKPASCIAVSKYGYFQLPSGNHWGCLYVIHMATLC